MATKKTAGTMKTSAVKSDAQKQIKMINASEIAFDDLKRTFFRETPKDVHGEFTWTNG